MEANVKFINEMQICISTLITLVFHPFNRAFCILKEKSDKTIYKAESCILPNGTVDRTYVTISIENIN